MANLRSLALLERASRRIPGGVNSPVRAFKAVGGSPLFIERGDGVYMFDVDGNRYIDYVLSWGPLILGHRPKVVMEALKHTLERGTSFGAPTEREVEFAELICGIIPGMDLVRMVNSGTEATMTAIRLARAWTKREAIIKFNGCYHGHSDALLVQAGSGVATFGIAGSSGVPETTAAKTLSVEFNDLEVLQESILAFGPERIAGIIVEPVPGNMGLVMPQEGYLQGLRKLCTHYGIALIFDEVMSGLRVALGGASERFSVTADIVTLGKVIGGGLPVGAVGGRREVMELLAPLGPVYQAGTLSGNPLAMDAGFAMVSELVRLNPYKQFEEFGKMLTEGIKKEATKADFQVATQYCGSMFGISFSEKPPLNFSDTKASDIQTFNAFFHAMLKEGVYLAPSAFEAGFLSTMHTEEVVEKTIDASRKAFQSLR